MGGSSTISISETKAEALTLQSSAYGVTVPVLGGQNRIAGNLLYYRDFRAIPHTKTQSSGKGGGAKTKSTTYTYAVNVLMGICHGQVGAVSTIWVDKRVYKGGWPEGSIESARETWYPPATGAMTYTLAHGATSISEPVLKVDEDVYVTVNGETTRKLKKKAKLVIGTHYTMDGSTATVIVDYLRGVEIKVEYQYGVGSPSLTPLQQIGATLMRGTITQPAAAWLTAIHPTEARAYPGLAYIHAQDYDLGSSTSVDNHSFEIQGWGAYSVNPASPDCNPASFAEMVLTHTRFGARLPSDTVDTELWETYCAAAGLLMSPVLKEQQRAADFIEEMARLTNSAPVWSYDTLRVVPFGDLPLTGNGVTYTPNTTPIYDLDDDCWLADGDEDPIEWELKQPSDRYNIVKVEYCNRATYYNRTIVEARDDADIALNGERQMDTVVCTWICDGDVARLVAQLILQRSLLVTGTGRVRLPWAYCLLEPMDLLTVTDAALGFIKLPVRVTSVVETEEGDLELELEDWPLGVADAARYQAPPAAGFLHDYGVSPGAVVAPVIFEAPVDRTTTGLEIYAAVRGNSDAWGGCRMWVSLDGLNYREAAIVYGGARYGTLTGPVASGSLPVQTSGQLVAASADDAAALETLCYVGGSSPEYLAYTTATLTGTGAYALGGLIRGAYGTTTAAHASGDPFVRVDDRIAKSGPLDATMIGKPIWVKFTSFNVYQAEEESLADVPAYSYTITGAMAGLKPGIAGKGLTVAASALTFQYPAAGGVNPASITLKASRKGTLAGAVSWSVISGTATVTGSGDTVTVAASSMTTEAVTVRATIVDPVATYTADTTLVKVREGAKGDQGSTGSPGSRYGAARAYRWGTGPAPTAAGTATWNWSAGTYDTAPSGWSKTPGTSPAAGYTLWQAERVMTDSSGAAATSAIDWAAASIAAISYAGTNGADGTTGPQGGTARIAYAKSTSSSLASTPSALQTSGSTSFPPANTWGGSETWGASVPTPSAGEWVYQVVGVYNPASGVTTWGVPFVATFRVGSLSALSANLGTINAGQLAAGEMRLGAGGELNCGDFVGYAWPASGGRGFHMSASGLLMGNQNDDQFFWVTSVGNIYMPGLSVVSGAATFSGTLRVGSSPAISGTTMTGSGGRINPDGTVCFGTSTSSIVLAADGKIYLNQPTIVEAPGPEKVMGGYFVDSSRVVTSGSVTLTAQLQFRTDGTIWQSYNNYSTGATVTSQVGRWYSETTAGIGSDYDVLVRRTSGDGTGFSTTAGAWTQVSANRLVTVTYTSSGQYTFESSGVYAFRRRSDGVQVGSGPWVLHVERAT